ncbi:MAG: FAD-dependent oxidoreductase [Myxococcota bacterium]|nr:FAD-dependent oxidoreductase [Myxococcota bacterium]
MGGIETIAVVGGSLAGLRGAEALRRLGYEGRLVFVGEEPHRPYDRPPLSKELLRGEREPEAVALAKPEAFAALELDLRLGRRAVALDPKARRVSLDDGEAVDFDAALVATGATPRRLPDTPALAGIHVLRTLDDALALRAELERSPRVAVVGAGFIGAEVAASCRKLGLEVTVIETLPLPLLAAVGRDVAEVCAAVHRDEGVDLRLGVGVEGFGGSDRVEHVKLADGTQVDADVVVVGIGVRPATDWLESSGLPLDDGLVCDATCAAAPGIYAAGDVARWHNPLCDEVTRVEHWTNAVEQANAAAENLLAGAEGATPFAPVPFVWSDQYDRKIQACGWPRSDDEVCFVHGTPEERRFVALYGRKGRLVGAVAMNRVRQLMACRRQMREGIGFEEAVAAARG